MGMIDDRYKYNNQEDANEFISNYLDALLEQTSDKYDKIGIYKENIIKLENENELVKTAFDKFFNKFYGRKGYSRILDLFYGNYITKKVCQKCQELVSVKFNAFNMIELPIYELANKNKGYNYFPLKPLNIDEILASYFSDTYDDEKCKNCGRKICNEKYIFKLPDNLIVFFGRTANDEYIDIPISYGKTLNLGKYMYKKLGNKTYSLSGIIHYIPFGKKDGIGHYTATIFYKKKSWIHFNDTIISKIVAIRISLSMIQSGDFIMGTRLVI